MKPSSRLVSAAVVAAIVASGLAPAFARGAGPRGIVFARHMHAPGRPRDAAGAARPFAFDQHGRHRLGSIPFFGAGVYGVPYPVIDDTPPEAAAAQPEPPAEPPRPPAPVAPVGPPAYVYAQIGFPDFAPRILYRHPGRRQRSHPVVVYYGTRQVDRTY